MKALRTLMLVILVLLIVGAQAPRAQLGMQPSNMGMQPSTAMGGWGDDKGTQSAGFPADFPKLKDLGGPGANTALTGFGGDHNLDQAGNRAAVKHIPVILVHGNGGSAEHPTWGMQTLKNFLKEAGYNDSEIWAVSYLGASNSQVDMNNPHRNNIGEVRAFIDAVSDYLSEKDEEGKIKEDKRIKVVLIGHSLGAGMIRSYMLGLDSDGKFKPSLTRFNRIKGLITLAGANYGLGSYSQSEFQSGCPFEVATHKVPGTDVMDDTPYGSKVTTPENSQSNTALPNGRNYNDGKFGFSGTSLDVDDSDPQRIYYAGFTAIGDFVDGQLANTSYLQGADMNQGWALGPFLMGHERVIKDAAVFKEGILPLLTKITQPGPPETRPVVRFTPNGGNFKERQTVVLNATREPDRIEYNINNGRWQIYGDPVSVTKSCTIYARASKGDTFGPTASAAFTKIVPITKTDTVNGHFIAKRIPVEQYLELGKKFGYINTVTLYSIDDGATWTDVNPES